MTHDQARARQRRVVHVAQACALVVSIASIGLVCCVAPPKTEPATPSRTNPQSPGALTIRVIVVTDAAGNSPWDSSVATEVLTLMRVFERAGFTPGVTIERLSRPEWFDARAAVRSEMMANRSATPTLWLLNSIDFTGVPARGFAAFDAFLAWDPNRCRVNAPHEVLHTLGLVHREVAGNVMRGAACGGESLAPDQVETVNRNRANRPAVCTEIVCGDTND